jgi:hypothetical protein
VGLFAARSLRIPHRLQFLRRRPAAVRSAGRDHLLDHLLVARQALHLVDRTLVVVQPQPGHRRQDLLDRILRRPRDVGVLDAQHELAAVWRA